MNPESIFEILELAHSQKRIVRLTLKSQRQLSVVLNGGLMLRPDGSNATSAFVAYVLPTRPESCRVSLAQTISFADVERAELLGGISTQWLEQIGCTEGQISSAFPPIKL